MLINEMNILLADLEKFRALIKQVHWYLKGNRFLYIHTMLDEYTTTFSNYIDDIGEMIIMLGGAPLTTLKEFDEQAEFEMDKGSYSFSIDDQLKLLIAALKVIYSKMQSVVELAEKEDNQIVIDLLNAKSTDVLKKIWMLSAEAGESMAKCKKCES